MSGATSDRAMMKRRPNILWVVTTQWRASATGYAGDVNARTPCLDALAKESVNYEQAVTPHPFGPFARAALLTGVLSPENGVKDYYDPLPVDARTVAHAMSERGYATGFFGKWHLARRDPQAALVGEAHARMVVPVEARGGFEFWEGFESGFLLNDPWLHGTRLAEPVKFEGYQSDVVCERAREWVRGQSSDARSQMPETEAEGRPWFCVVSLEAPHPPYDAPAAGVARRAEAEVMLAANVPRGGAVEAKARRELAGYYSHIEATDRTIGRLFADLQAGGVWDETVVVFTSVHGDMHGAHGLFRKGWPHEESVRVPLLVKTAGRGEGPGAKGEKRSGAVSLVELSRATVGCAESGVFEVRARVAGAAISMPSVVGLPHQCDRVWRGVRTATRKLVLNADGAPWLFFDLENDPGELRNLAGEAAWAGEMAEMMRGMGAQVRKFGQD